MRITRRFVRDAGALALGAGMAQFIGCSPRAIVNYFTNTFNPCNTILACDPAEFRFLTSGYEGPGVRPDIDPACVYPPFCANDPFVGGQTGGNP